MAKKEMKEASMKSGTESMGESSDIGKSGFSKSDFGGVEKENYRVGGGYVSKDESPTREEKTKIHEIAKHTVVSKFYSDSKGDGSKSE